MAVRHHDIRRGASFLIMDDSVDIVVVGHLCLDLIPRLSSSDLHFAPGRMIELGAATFVTGGAVANTGLALHTLGMRARLVGKIGDDLFGTAVRQIITAHGAGLADDLVNAPGEATSYTIVLSPPNTDRMFLYAPGCNATFRADDVPDTALHGARLMHFGYPTLMERMWQHGGAELATLFMRARRHGLLTSLDLAMPELDSAPARADWRMLFAAVLPFVDLFMPSVEELLALLRPATFARLAAAGGALLDRVTPELVSDLSAELLQLGANIVMIKLGHRGLYLRTAAAETLASMRHGPSFDVRAWASRERWIAPYDVQVAGTTGAGDAAIAGLLMALLRGMPPDAALAAASAVAACCVEASDATSGVRPWPQTQARMANWTRMPRRLDAPGWRWDAEYALWVGPHDRS
jgi:sugar/nucleoside kinase (ribokinase family)